MSKKLGQSIGESTSLSLGRDVPFHILSDGKTLIIIMDDTVIVMEDHYLREVTTHIQHDMIDCTPLGAELRQFLHGLRSVDLDLSISVNGEISYYQGKDILKKFDIFKNFKLLDLLTAIRTKLKVREEKLKE